MPRHPPISPTASPAASPSAPRGCAASSAPGSNRMNRVLVAQAAAGLAAYLLETRADATATSAPTVVIGYDGRRNSDVFAQDSAELFAGAGLRAILLPRLLPTPVLAFAVRHLGADAGVMVTASHNPPNDNGYKVYLGGADDGAQIVLAGRRRDRRAHPADRRRRRRRRSPPLARLRDGAASRSSTRTSTATAAVAPGTGGRRGAALGLHGDARRRVGDALAHRRGRRATPRPMPVAAQLDPDGAFPTVAFPNPEEPGAMDLAFETARDAERRPRHRERPRRRPPRRRGARPARRRAAGGGSPATRSACSSAGAPRGWRAEADAAAGASLACSLVSSPGLKSVAEHYGLDFHTTLTGFKWISRAPGLVFGFEEALGYLVNPETVRDKDGISAAIAMLGMVDRSARARREPRASARRVRRDLRLLRERPDLDPRGGRLDDRPDHGRAAGAASVRRSATSRSTQRRRPARRASTTCPPATCCGCGWPTGRASSCARAAPSPS